MLPPVPAVPAVPAVPPELTPAPPPEPLLAPEPPPAHPIVAEIRLKLQGPALRKGAAEDLAHRCALELVVAELVEALPHLAEQQRRIPKAAEHERDERGDDDGEPIDLRRVHSAHDVRERGVSGRAVSRRTATSGG